MICYKWIDAWCVKMKSLDHSNCRLALDNSKKLLSKEGNLANNLVLSSDHRLFIWARARSLNALKNLEHYMKSLYPIVNQQNVQTISMLRFECPYCNKGNPISTCKLVCVDLQNEVLLHKTQTYIAPRKYKSSSTTSHVFHKDSSSNSCSRLIPLAIRSFSFAVISTSPLRLIRGLRLTTMVDVEAVILRFLAECRNPFGVCRKCLAIWWAGLLSLRTVFCLLALFELPCSAVFVEINMIQI